MNKILTSDIIVDRLTEYAAEILDNDKTKEQTLLAAAQMIKKYKAEIEYLKELANK